MGGIDMSTQEEGRDCEEEKCTCKTCCISCICCCLPTYNTGFCLTCLTCCFGCLGKKPWVIKILSIILVVLAIASASKQYEYGYFPIAQIIHVGLMILHTIGLFRRNSQLMTIGFYVCWFEALLRILFLLLAAICN